MKKLFLAVVSVTFSVAALAGQINGNGGDVVTCGSNANSLNSIEMLDLYEVRAENRPFTYVPSNRPVEQVISGILLKVSELDEIRAQRLEGFFNSFFAETRIDHLELVDIPDSEHLHYPPNCQVEQVAVQRIPQFQGESRYIINQRLWDQMDLFQQSALVLHEILYRDAISFGHTDSRVTRYMTAWLLSQEFSAVTKYEFTQFLEQYNLFPGLLYPNIHLNQLQHIQRYENGNVKSAKIAGDQVSFFQLQGQRAELQPGSKIKFYESGTLEFVRLSNSVTVQIGEYNVQAIGRTEFFEDFELKSVGLLNPVSINVRGSSMRVWEKIEVHPNGSLRDIRLLEPQSIQVAGRPATLTQNVFFYESGKIERSYLHSPVTFHQGGVEVTINDHFELHDNGKLREGTLDFDHRVNVYGTDFELKESGRVAFYRSGSVRLIGTERAQEYEWNGQVIRSTVFTWYEGGNLQSAYITRGSYRGKYIGQNRESHVFRNLSLSRNGRILTGALTTPQRLKMGNGLRALMQGPTYFYENGHLQRTDLVQEVELEHMGQTLVVGSVRAPTPIVFYESGQLESASLARNTVIPVAGRDAVFASKTVQFEEGGNLVNGVLAEPLALPIQGMDVKYQGYIKFYSTGEIRQGQLLNETVLMDVNGVSRLISNTRLRGYTPSGLVSNLY